jgi:WD40 repeat protein/serine/threonine protein kinase
VTEPILPDSDSQLELLIKAFLETEAMGLTPSRAEWLVRHPEHADGLRRFWTAHDGITDPGQTVFPAEPGATQLDPSLTTRPLDPYSTVFQDVPESAPFGDDDTIRYFGDYQLIQELGRGGMGVVYKARQVNLNRLVALKLIKSASLASDLELQRFQNEAEAVAMLDHPAIVPILEIGSHGEERFFSMKLIEGGSLDKRLDEYRDNPKATARLVETIARAIHHAHQRGILHRDLKPANILIDEQGQPHVTDFGLAKRVDGESELTHSGTILGTPAFMAPEQASGRKGEVTTSSDVYGVGAILYSLMAGRAPFRGNSLMETLELVRDRAPELPAAINPNVSRDLQVICLKCLAKEPSRRYASAQALADDLRRYQANEPIDARPVAAWERAWLWCKRNPGLAAAVGTTAASILAVAVFALLYAAEQTKLADQEAQARTKISAINQQLEQKGESLTKALAESNLRLATLDSERAESDLSKNQLGPSLIRTAASWKSARSAGDTYYQDDARAAISTRSGLFPDLRAVFTSIAHPDAGVAISPDGESILTAADGKNAQLWSARTGKPIGPPLVHPAFVNAVAISADGKTLLTACLKTARLWNATTATPIGTPIEHPSLITAIAFSPDSHTVITSGYDGTVQAWSTDTGKPAGRSLKHSHVITCVAFSPDGKTLLSGSQDTTATLWNLSTSQPLAPPLSHQGPVMAVAFSPDGKIIATASADKSARLWDATNGKPLGKPLVHDNEVSSVAFSPDGRTLLTGSHDKTARLWDVASGRRFDPPMNHDQWIRSVAFSPDGRLAITGSDDNTARLWDVASGAPLSEYPHQGPVVRVAFCPDGKSVVTRSWDGTARLWSTTPRPPIGPAMPHAATITFAAFRPDGKVIIMGCDDGLAQLHDTATGQPLASIRHERSIIACAFSHDSHSILTGGLDSGVRLSDARTGAPLGPLVKAPLGLLNLSLRPDHSTAMSMSRDGRIQIWNARDGAISRSFNTGLKVRSAAFNAEGTRVVLGSETDAQVWDLATERLLGKRLEHESAVDSVAFSHDGTRVITGSRDNSARVWNAETGEPIGSPLTHAKGVGFVGFRPDDRAVLTLSLDGTARVWDAATGSPISPALVHKEESHGRLWGGFSPDGTRVFTAGYGLKARLWDAHTGRAVRLGLPHLSTTLAPVFSPDGSTILTCVTPKSARLQSTAELPDNAERIATWIEVRTGLALDDRGRLTPLDNRGWQARSEALTSLGGSPTPDPRWDYDLIHLGPFPLLRAQTWLDRGRKTEAAAAFNAVRKARPLDTSLLDSVAKFRGDDVAP